MKSVLSFCLFVACISPSISPPPMMNNIMMKVMGAVNKCRAKHKISDAVFMDMVMKMKIPDDEDVKCMMACFMKETEQFKDGEFNEEIFESFNRLKWRKPKQQQQARDINLICMEEEELDRECDMAYDLLQCFLREATKVGLPLSFSGQANLM